MTGKYSLTEVDITELDPTNFRIKNIMKPLLKRITRLQVAAASLVLLVSVLRPAMAAPELLDRIVAVVDDQVILWSELNLRLSLELQQQGLGFIGPEEVAFYRERTLDSMIDEQIIVLKAKQDSIEIDFSRVDDLLNAELGRIKDSITPAEFHDMLQRTGISERQLKTRYRKQIQNRMLYEQMLGQLAYRSFITRGDVELFRKAHEDTLPPKISISQINIKVNPSPDVLTKAMGKISGLQQDIETGSDFEELARKFSEDPSTSETGGDLGCFDLGMLMPEFEMAALELRPNEISQPVRTKHGFHLIRLREKRETELCASHILVKAEINLNDRERAVSRLEELRERILRGENFAQLATEYSEDPQSARAGGLWQILDKQQIPPFLQAHLSHLKLGEITRPFLLENDGHILKINDDHATLETLVREERIGELMDELINDLKSEIYVEKRLDEEKFLWNPHEAENNPAKESPAVGERG